MPTPFEFPLSYIESMMPHADADGGTAATPSGPAAPDINQLLASLENETVPQPQQPQQWQRILGALGDALGSAAAVRAGGAPVPVGPFAANLRQQQLTYEQRQQQAAQEAVNTRNTVRIGAFRENMRARRELENVRARAAASPALQPNVSYQEIGGRRIRILDNPASGTITSKEDLGPASETGGGRVQLVKNARGQMEPVDVASGKSLWTGKPVETAAPSGMLGVKQNLAEARRMMDELAKNYMAGPGHVNPQTNEFEFGPGDLNARAVATAAANFTREGTLGKKLGLGGYAAKLDPHAVLHQRDLDLIPVSLAFPLSMTRRAVEGPMKAIRGALPDYSDPPYVWGVFTRQMNDIIDIAETLPWDSDPDGAANTYQARLMQMVSTVGAAKDKAASPTPPASNPSRSAPTGDPLLEELWRGAP